MLVRSAASCVGRLVPVDSGEGDGWRRGSARPAWSGTCPRPSSRKCRGTCTSASRASLLGPLAGSATSADSWAVRSTTRRSTSAVRRRPAVEVAADERRQQQAGDEDHHRLCGGPGGNERGCGAAAPSSAARPRRATPPRLNRRAPESPSHRLCRTRRLRHRSCQSHKGPVPGPRGPRPSVSLDSRYRRRPTRSRPVDRDGRPHPPRPRLPVGSRFHPRRSAGKRRTRARRSPARGASVRSRRGRRRSAPEGARPAARVGPEVEAEDRAVGGQRFDVVDGEVFVPVARPCDGPSADFGELQPAARIAPAPRLERRPAVARDARRPPQGLQLRLSRQRPATNVLNCPRLTRGSSPVAGSQPPRVANRAATECSTSIDRSTSDSSRRARSRAPGQFQARRPLLPRACVAVQQDR